MVKKPKVPMSCSPILSVVNKVLKLKRPHLYLLQNCPNMKELSKFHCHFITGGLSDQPIFLSTILSFAALSPSGDLSYAHLLFDHATSPTIFMFNTLIRAYASSSAPLRSLSLYIRLLRSQVLPNNYTYPFLIKASSRILDPGVGKSLHGSVLKSGFISDLHILNSLLHLYASFGFSEMVGKLFDEMPSRDVVSWNVVIDDLSHCGCVDDVLTAFCEMGCSGIEPNSVTVLAVLSACSKAGDLCVGKLAHLYIVMNGLVVTGNLGNGLLDMYVKCGDMDSARRLFALLPVKSVFSWTSMIDGLMQKGEVEEARSLFDQMPEKDTTAWNVMLNGFISVDDIEAAEHTFEAIPSKDLVSWNSMIVCYAHKNKLVKCLELFREMLIRGVKPDHITLAGLFSVGGFSGMLVYGQMIHCYTKKLNIKGEEVDAGLIDMYCKCGSPGEALLIFNGNLNKSGLAWSTMIAGMAMNGLANEALEFFHQMQGEGVKPNDHTFISLLSACSHAGMVEQGKWFFTAMKQVYGIEPRAEHYSCMVDILGRAGMLKEAEGFIQKMPFEADACVLRALLGACKLHGEVQMGERVARILDEIDPRHSGRFVALSNMYAAEERWEDVEKVRKEMRGCGVNKIAGFSFIQLKGQMHHFLAGHNQYFNFMNR